MDRVQIIGILNLTPDSFSDGGLYNTYQKALDRAEELFASGADLIDVGAESTRPGAQALNPEEEWMRLDPVLPKLLERYGALISLDTRHEVTMKRFIDLGGKIINDVTGFPRASTRELVAYAGVKIIVNHCPGGQIGQVHDYQIDSLEQVRDELIMRKWFLIRSGVLSENIILDPGIGFGKTMELNRKLLEFAHFLPEEKILIGHSRKRFLGEHRFENEVNFEAGKIAVNSGAAYLRVHDPEIYR